MRNCAHIPFLLLFSSLFFAGYSVAEPQTQDPPSSLSSPALPVQNEAHLQQQLEQKIQQLQQKRQQYEQQLATLDQRIGDDMSRLDQAQKALEHATARYVTDASETSQAKIKNARFKIVLAKRQVKNNSEQQIQLTQQLSTLSARLHGLEQQQVILANDRSAATATATDTTSTAITTGYASVPVQQSSLGHDIKERLSAAEIAAEITRLNNLLQQNKSTPQRTAAQLGVDHPTTVDMMASELIGDGSNSDTATKPIASAPKAQQTRSARLRLLNTRTEVERSVRELQDLLSAKKGRPTTFNKMIIVKHSTTAEDLIKSISYTLRSLGQDRYRAQIRLQPGQNQLVVGFNRWRLSASDVAPSAGNSSTGYIVVMNNSDPELPELLLYRSNLQ